MSQERSLHLLPVATALVLCLVTATAVPAQRRGRQRPDRAPRQGATAPDFTLSVLHSEETRTLSELVVERPVALLFGSYT